MPRDTRPESLPILTETADGTSVIPILTEAIDEHLANTANSLQLSEDQYQKMADILLPQIEIVLFDAIESALFADWKTAMMQVRGELPALIRNALQEVSPTH
ncbi:MAG: hypothetical protein WA632_12050 [Gallionella sp.]